MRIATCLFIALALALAARGDQEAPKPSQKEVSAELERLEREDQADQDDVALAETPEFGRRQRVRRERAMEILQAGMLATPADFQNAAMLFQHGTEIDDFLLAHVLATAAGCEKSPPSFSRFLSAAALDRFLRNIEAPQRFGTQFGASGEPLEPFEPSVGPSLWRIFQVDAPKGTKAAEANAGGKASARELGKFLKQAKGEHRAEGCAGLLALLRAGDIDKGKDLAAIARALSESDEAEHLLHAHIAAIAAAFQGEKGMRALCAETLDQWLVAIERPQRFGTVHGDEESAKEPWDRSWHDIVRLAYDLEPLDPANAKLGKK